MICASDDREKRAAYAILPFYAQLLVCLTGGRLLGTADALHFGVFLFEACPDTDLSTPHYLHFTQPFFNILSIDVSEDLSRRTLSLPGCWFDSLDS
jgi:hypothetical protein